MPVLLTKKYPSHVADIEEEIRRRLALGDTSSFLYIVPTKRKVRELQREFLSCVPRGIASSFSLFTLETLAADLYKLICPPRRAVTGPVQAVLMQEAIRSLEGKLKYFRIRKGNRSLPQGTFQKIINVINYLKDRGVYRSGLYAEIETAEVDDKAKLQDVLAMYDAYEDKLGENYVDAAGILKEVNLRWRESKSEEKFFQSYPACRTIFVSGFDEFSDPELTMIHHLSNMPAIGTVISFDYHLENDNVFGHLKDNYEKLLSMGFDKREAEPGPNVKFQDFIAGHLFRSSEVQERLQCKETVTLLAAESREAEVELIAKLIKRLAHDNPALDLNTVCVSLFQPQLYTPLFREVFDRYGIPANITDRYHLNQSPLVIAILSLLEMQQRNFRLSDIMRALSTPYLDFSYSKEAIDAGNLYAVATTLKISSGKKTWFARITQRIALIEEDRTSAEDEFEEARLLHEQEMLRKAYNDLERLTVIMKRFSDPMSPEEFKARLHSLLDDLRVLERILAVPSLDQIQLERDTRAYEKLLSFVEEFVHVLVLEGQKDDRMPLSFYVERLKLAVTQVRYNVRQKYGYGVYVTSFDETRGLKFDVMCIAGLADGEFPPLYAHEFLFSTTRQQQQERNHLNEHRYLFYQALTNFSRHVYLTFPSRDGDNEIVPSPFIDALCTIVDLDDCRKELPKNLIECLYSEDEMQRYLGTCAGNNLPLRNDHPVFAELREAFEHISRGIDVENSRVNQRQFPEFNGVIAQHLSVTAKSALERFRSRVYSVTQLESYGKCPFQFFADKVLRLNVTKKFDDGLSPVERGSLLHDILFEFYTRRREADAKPLHLLEQQQFQEALNDLLAIAREKLNALTVSSVFWEVDKEMMLGSDKRKGLLEEFLEAERLRAFETSPAFFEAAFGPIGGGKQRTDHRLTMASPINVGSVQLRGKVDRVDVGEDIFTIIDYKSGTRVIKRKDMDVGMSLQIPLYLLAVEYMMNEVYGRQMKGVGGIYYHLKPPVEEHLGIGSKEYAGKAFTAAPHNNQLTENDEELRSVIQQAVAFVNEYVDSIARGKFPVAPKDPDNICRYCDFKSICRVQLQRTLPKEQEI
jgi:ATP-dependent helicase/nuclease subunit B